MGVVVRDKFDRNYMTRMFSVQVHTIAPRYHNIMNHRVASLCDTEIVCHDLDILVEHK